MKKKTARSLGIGAASVAAVAAGMLLSVAPAFAQSEIAESADEAETVSEAVENVVKLRLRFVDENGSPVPGVGVSLFTYDKGEAIDNIPVTISDSTGTAVADVVTDEPTVGGRQTITTVSVTELDIPDGYKIPDLKIDENGFVWKGLFKSTVGYTLGGDAWADLWGDATTALAFRDDLIKVTAREPDSVEIQILLNRDNKEEPGWVRSGERFRYLGENGAYYTGWHYMTSKEGERIPHWSFFDNDAFLTTGWKYMTSEQGEKTPHWSYFGDNGWLRTGWQRMSTSGNPDGNTPEHLSYFGSNGWLRTGWVQLGKGTSDPDGNTERHLSYFGSNGWLRTGWLQLGKGTSDPDGDTERHFSYFGPNGWLRIGMQEMGGTRNPDGNTEIHKSFFGGNGWLVTNQVLTLGNLKYNADARGWLTSLK